jgi:hypothetical protein
MFLAGVNISPFKFLYEKLIGIDEPANGIAEREEAALKPLDEQNLHEFAHFFGAVSSKLICGSFRYNRVLCEHTRIAGQHMIGMKIYLLHHSIIIMVRVGNIRNEGFGSSGHHRSN